MELTSGIQNEQETLFVEVILPLPIAGTYTYRIPKEWNEYVAVGKRVIVQFGKNRIYSAIIYKASNQAPEKYEAKYVLDIMDEEPIVLPSQFLLWEWMSSYYLCSIGEIMQAALPNVLKLASETHITRVENADFELESLSEKEYLILEALDAARMLKVSDVVKVLGQKSVFPLLKRMFDKGLIMISEEISEKFKPKLQIFFKLAEEFAEQENVRILMDSLNRAPKQQDVLLAYLQLEKRLKTELAYFQGVNRKDLMEASGGSSAVISTMVGKGIFQPIEKVVSRLSGEDIEIDINFELNQGQAVALQQIRTEYQTKDVVLLHGVTSSGKTQIYIRLIEEVLRTEADKQILFLLPEIALTAQMTERLKLHFGPALGVYHSRFNDQERAELWKKTLSGEIRIILGARSSLFLPFKQLGLVVVDEEHENSFKQFDPAPRYHARDSAVFLGQLHQAKVLLGSATPSLESYYNAKNEKYGFVQLRERFGLAQLPEIEIIDIKKAGKENQMKSYFSTRLLAGIKTAVEQKEQVILFQNRRGHTPVVQCHTCGFIARCLHCDVSLTYHKSSGKLLCHYCGYQEDPLVVCPACGSAHLESKGYGTERIEEELGLLLPDLRIGRLDLDSTRGKHGFDRVLAAFDDHQYDVLIGTQMVAKGLDFGNVSLIGIINADSLIHYPEFRAYEKAYALLAQVAGRAGRRDKRGQVIIQTYTPQHRILDQVVRNDYEGMYEDEIAERAQFSYPPFQRLIHIDVRHPNANVAEAAAHKLTAILKQSLAERIVGPEQPLVSRVRNLFIHRIMIKLDRSQDNIPKAKNFIAHTIQYFRAEKSFKGMQIQIDVDPY